MIEYFYEVGMRRYRVWCKGWPGDTFVLMSPERFEQLKIAVLMFSEILNLTETVD